jgi:hypothetical protein
VDPGSREENASTQEIRSFGSDSIRTDLALIAFAANITRATSGNGEQAWL